MSLVDRLEQALAKLAEGGAEAVFGGKLDLVAVGQELFNVAARDARLREGGAEAPSSYTVSLALADYGELVDEIERLQGQYRTSLWGRLRQADYTVEGLPRVLVTSSETVAGGVFRIESAFADADLSLAVAQVAPPGVAHRLRAPITIGRDVGCDISLDSPSVSRSHAQILWDRNHFRVVDLNSKNGTRLNRTPVTSAAIEPGDTLQVGEVVLRFSSVA